MTKESRKKCFTLIEVLVSMVIIAIISIGSYTYYMISTRSVEDARNRSMATNLLRMSMEEVRKAANNDFDNLENFSFGELPPEFSGFTRTLTVTSYTGSSECKKADISITWTEHGKQKVFHESMLISRPPEPLPGNIEGTVTNSDTSEPVSGVTIYVYYKDKPSNHHSTFTNHDGYYTLTDERGNFILKPGIWVLSAEKSGYYDYPREGEGSVEIEVPEKESVEYNFSMTHLPEDAYIRGKVVDKDNGTPLSQLVCLYKNGSRQNERWTSGDGSFEFTIPFEDTNEQCFTIVTGRYESSYPYRRYNNANDHIGDFCDPHGWGKDYNYRGWSSSVVRSPDNVPRPGGLACGNPWFGSESTDRICVEPGDDLDIGNIPLVVRPTATIEGTLYDSERHPIQGQIYVWRNYSSGNNFWWYGWADTDENGHYSVTVPAEQEYFPDNQRYYIRMRARARVARKRCCDIEAEDWSYTPWPYTYVGPLYAGDTAHQDFIIPSLDDQTCGNVKGYIKDFKTGGGIKNVDMRIYWDWWRDNVTDASGYFEIKCEGDTDSCALTTGTRHFAAVDNRRNINGSQYYILQSHYTYNYSYYWYNRNAIPEMHIVANTTSDYGTIWLYPKGFGKIKGRVIDAGTEVPLEGATVKLNVYANCGDPFGGIYDKTVTTGPDGKFEFDNVIETWPPPDVMESNYFNYDSRYHTVTVNAGDDYYEKTVTINSLLANQTLDLGDVKLGAKGGGA